MSDGHESDDDLMPPMPPTKMEEEEAAPAEDDKALSLANPDVVTKYKEAAMIAQTTLIEIVGKVRCSILLTSSYIPSHTTPRARSVSVSLERKSSIFASLETRQ